MDTKDKIEPSDPQKIDPEEASPKSSSEEPIDEHLDQVAGGLIPYRNTGSPWEDRP